MCVDISGNFPREEILSSVSAVVLGLTGLLSAGRLECMKLLLAAGADVDSLDAKAQTPLFVSLVNQHWDCARLLLEAGADPNGSQANLCSPLSIMCQRGFYPGVKVLASITLPTIITVLL